MQYKVAETLKLGTSVSGRARNGELRGETAHELGVVEDPGYLLACHWPL